MKILIMQRRPSEGYVMKDAGRQKKVRKLQGAGGRGSLSGSLTAGEGDPAGVFGGFSAPVWRHEQSTGDSEGDDAHDDEE